MAHKPEAALYRRLNTYMADYINAVEKGADPEELHSRLRELMAEAIRMDITLEKMLKVFSSSNIEDGTVQKFIEKISKHHSRAMDTAHKKRELVDAAKD